MHHVSWNESIWSSTQHRPTMWVQQINISSTSVSSSWKKRTQTTPESSFTDPGMKIVSAGGVKKHASSSGFHCERYLCAVPRSLTRCLIICPILKDGNFIHSSCGQPKPKCTENILGFKQTWSSVAHQNKALWVDVASSPALVSCRNELRLLVLTSQMENQFLVHVVPWINYLCLVKHQSVPCCTDVIRRPCQPWPRLDKIGKTEIEACQWVPMLKRSCVYSIECQKHPEDYFHVSLASPAPAPVKNNLTVLKSNQL